MPTPTASWGTHRVFATWKNMDGTRKAGQYTGFLATRVTNETDDVIVPIGQVASGTLNTVNMAAPALDILVPANDDPDNTPNGWFIGLTITFLDGAPPESYILDTPLGGETNLREVIFPQAISDAAPGFLRGVAGGIAGLDSDGDVVDADGVKVTGGGGIPVGADLDDIIDSATRLALTSAQNTKLNALPDNSTLTSTLATKAPLASPTFTGTVVVPVASGSTSPVQKAYVDAADALKAPLASPAFTGSPTGISKMHVGLGSVDDVRQLPLSMAQPRIKATAANTWPTRATNIPSGYTGDVLWDHTAFGSVTTLPSDIATNDIVADLAP